jgi:hypothetical protein
VAFGLLPIIFAGRLRLTEVLAEDGGGSLGAGRSGVARVRAAILAGQIAVACVLLLGALQLGRSFFAQLEADRGYTTSGLLVAPLPFPAPLYTPERSLQILEGLLERLDSVPGVERAATTNVHPLSNSEAVAAFTLDAPLEGSDAEVIHTAVRTVTPGYFEVLGRKLVAGRFLDVRDTASARPVLVVNRTFARHYLGEPPVGAILPMGIDELPDWEVVGVVEDARGPAAGCRRSAGGFLRSEPAPGLVAGLGDVAVDPDAG